MRIPPLLIEHRTKGWAGGAAFQPARLIIETLQCGKLFRAAEPSLRNRSLQHPDRLVIDRDRHRKRVPVLAAMRDRKARRVGKAVGRAMDGWAMTPSGTRGMLNDALSIYFADAPLCSSAAQGPKVR